MSGNQIGRFEQACGRAACTRNCCSGRQHLLLLSIVLADMNLLLSNAIPAAFGERNTVRSHDFQVLGIGVDPTNWFESTWVREDGGIVVRPVGEH